MPVEKITWDDDPTADFSGVSKPSPLLGITGEGEIRFRSSWAWKDDHKKPWRGEQNAVPVSESYREYVLDQLKLLGSVTSRSMFGGAGLYHDGLIFGILADDILYLKVDDSNRPDYEREGMKPFRPRGTTMPYYQVPAEVLEERETLKVWAQEALTVSRRKSSARRKKKYSR